MHYGQCIGGPLNGQTFPSRFPEGFLVVNKPKAEIAIYDYDSIEKKFNIRKDENGNWKLPELTDGPKNRYRAAEENSYDVVAFDPARMTW